MKHKLSTTTALLAIAALLLATTAFAASSNLPGGTAISVAVTLPADAAVIAETDATIPVQGSAAVGQGVAIPNTLLVYVLDVSGSANSLDGCGGDLNGDGRINTILDCEIAAAIALNSQAAAAGNIGEVGVVAFSGWSSTTQVTPRPAAAGDVSPAPSTQLLTGPGIDANNNNVSDVEEVLRSATAGVVVAGSFPFGLNTFTRLQAGNGSTSYAAGIEAALDIVNSSALPNKVVIFMSDGANNRGADVSALQLAAVASGAIFNSFAVGSSSLTCNTPASPSTRGNLTTVAQLGATGGQCYEVGTVAQLPNILPTVLASTLSSLSLAVDGGAAVDITGSAIPALPQNGPTNVAYATSITNLAPGSHELCVTANGSDAGGAGTVTECVDVTVNAQPDASAGGPYGGSEGLPIALSTATASDAENDPLVLSWSVDSALCSFDDASALNPSLTCSDDGSFTVTLSVSDGINQAALSSAPVTVANTAPTVNAGLDQAVSTGATVNLSGSFTDPAAAADNPYTWAWDLDGDTVADISGNANYGDPLPASTSFAAAGAYVLTLTVTDKDGDSGSDTLTVTVNAPPVCTTAAPSQGKLWPANHALASIDVLGVTDPDGDAVTIAISSIFQDEPTNGLGDGDMSPDGFGVGTGTAQVRAERAGGGNGRFYHIRFTATDPYGAACSGEVLVSVPKSQGKGGAAVNDGALFDSTLP